METARIREHYSAAFKRLRLNPRPGGTYSPHKVCMLLAVLDMARAGLLNENRVRYEPTLIERYRRYFDAVKAPGDHPNPYFPFFHLGGTLRDGTRSFWTLHALPGREAALERLGSARNPGHITENVEYASLEPELHALIQSPAECDALSDVLSDTWFGRSRNDLKVLLGRVSAISRYERLLRGGAESAAVQTQLHVDEPPPPAYVRSPAFRRVVVQAYDYRCAASGERIITPTGEALVEAAHIRPFSESGDDDPRNGLALSRDMHWAMDRNLIAPGPDHKWHVSRMLDVRIPDFQRLCRLEGQHILLPKETRLMPKLEALEWRMERLRDVDWTPPLDLEIG